MHGTDLGVEGTHRETCGVLVRLLAELSVPLRCAKGRKLLGITCTVSAGTVKCAEAGYASVVESAQTG